MYRDPQEHPHTADTEGVHQREVGLDDAGRPLRLLRRLLILSAIILAAGAIVLVIVLTRDAKSRAVADERHDLISLIRTSVVPTAVVHNRLRVGSLATRQLRSALEGDPDVVRLQIWTRDGRLAWTSARRKPRPGTKPSDGVLRAGLAGSPTATEGGGSLTVNVPVRRQGRPLAVFSVTADAGAIDALVSDTRRTLIAVIGLVFGAILAGVITVVVVLGWRVSQQARELSERADELVASYRELEQSSIEAIETLNATVEAKDPYTAGHSQRVRRIALAIGRELQLPPKRLGILAQAALFHDVGKIGVPDAILTKPSRLTPSEYDVMKRHAADGADIIARLSRLKDAVPAVRHHHEHWDGCGYPDGLRAEEIPLEASIIGLADAWDAMTTTRPYAAARSQEDAMAQLEIGSGVQFNPAVVHAFFEVAQRRPQEIKPPGEKPLLAAAI